MVIPRDSLPEWVVEEELKGNWLTQVPWEMAVKQK